jgi:hypothetical protein
MRNSAALELYPIINDGYHYYAGQTKEGNQVLMGVQLPDIVAVEFSAAGELLHVLSRRIALDPPQNTLDLDSSEVREALDAQQSELGFVPGTIAVRKFFLPDLWIGIADLPEHYQDVIDRPEDYDKERLQELQGDIQTWLDGGDFVLYWVEDYYLNAQGELESS